jgi:predicted component of type VI protein secretion system
MDKTLDGTMPKKSALAWLKDKALVLVISSKNFGSCLVMQRGDNPVGRGEENSLAIADAKMSKQHFSIRYSADGYFISDCESKNGTWLNGKRLTKPAKLAYGDRIIAGTTIFRFFIEESLNKD